MNPNSLTIGTKLKGRASKAVVTIEDHQPAFQQDPQQWMLRGQWFNLAQLDARYTLYNPSEREPKNKKKPAAQAA